MIPDRVGKIHLGQVAFHCLYHKREAIGVICPVSRSIVNKYLFVSFDVSSGAQVQSIAFSEPFGIFAVFVQWVVSKTSERDDSVEDWVKCIDGVYRSVFVFDREHVVRCRSVSGGIYSTTIFTDDGLVSKINRGE